MYFGRCNVQIEKAMADGRPRTVHELTQLTGINRSAISKSLSRMIQRGEAHIAAWKREMPGTRAYLRAAYLLGEGKNVIRPPRLTRAQASRRYRNKTEMTEWKL